MWSFFAKRAEIQETVVVLDLKGETEGSSVEEKEEPVIYRNTERSIFDPARRIAYRAESRRRLRHASGII